MQEIIPNDFYEVLTEEGYKNFDGILKSFNKPTIKVKVSDNELICTPEHLIKLNGEFVEAQTLEHIAQDDTDVYDLINVEDCHHYITNGITSHNCLYIDECAFVENFDEFFTSVFPTISSGNTTKLILTSTPSGLNHFYQIWTNAINGKNGYHPIKITWEKVPGRDENWKQKQLEGFNFDQQKFDVEYNCEFMGSTNTLISGQKLKELVDEVPIFDKNHIKQYQKPKPGRTYTLVADVAEGKGFDYSAFHVIDITEMPYQQVLTYKDNEVTPIDYASIIHATAQSYNQAFVLVELNNNMGGIVTNSLHYDYEYENLLYTETANKLGRRLSTGFSGAETEIGIRTTVGTKMIGCSILKLLIEQEQLIINDFDTIHELSVFSKAGKTYQAESGHKDDLVMALVMFAWMTNPNNEVFKHMTDINTLMKLRKKSEQELESEMLPIGYHVTGHDIELPNNNDMTQLIKLFRS